MGFDYYEVLEISKSATDYDIKMAFRQLAIRYNPERNKDEKFKPVFTLICEAYEILSDKFRKAVYDQYGGDAMKKGITTPLGFVPPYDYDGNTRRTFLNFFGTDNPFADILNAYRLPQKKQTIDGRGDVKSDVNQRIRREGTPDGEVSRKNLASGIQQLETVLVSLEEIYRGGVKLLTVPVHQVDPCSDEFNIIRTSKIVHVKIKPGLPENTVIRFPREPHEYSTSTELLVVTKDKPHGVFWREGVDLHMNKSVALKEALIGFSFTVTTLDGRILHVPITEILACTGSRKVIKAEGMPHVEEPHKRGDLIIHFHINFPKTFTEDIRKSLGTLLDKDLTRNTTRQILDSKLKSKAGNLDFDD